MRSKRNATIQRPNYCGQRPNWVLIAGGALLSTLSFRLGCKLKQAFETKQKDKGNIKFAHNRLPGVCQIKSNPCQCNNDEDTRYQDRSDGGRHIKQCKISMSPEMDIPLPVVKFGVGEEEPNKDWGSVVWASSPERHELPQKPFHRSSSSDSPCFSESGSDIYSKREVIQKLRQQLRRRDDMIMEMHAHIMNLQNCLDVQITRSGHLQAQLDTANRDLFDSEREIQRLRKIIADYCITEMTSPEKPASHWWPEVTDGTMNGHADSADDDLELPCMGMERGRIDSTKVAMLKREVGELKEVIQGKDFLIQSYREHKAELYSKMEELQLRLNAHVPNIL